MTTDRDDRSGSYRRRLARAAAASCVLHMLLFGGLSVSKLDLGSPPADSLEARPPRKPKRPAADFRLQVSRSPATERPAHERPLAIPLEPLAIKPVDRRDQPPERTIATAQPRPDEAPAEVAPAEAAIEPARPRDIAAAPSTAESPRRQTDASPAEATAAAAAAEPAATAEATAAAAAPAAPAALSARESRPVGRVAARWKPREVALLERLTARAPDAATLAARDRRADEPALATSGSPGRQTAAAGAASDARAEAITPAAAATAAATTPIAPISREPVRRPASTSATASQRAARTPSESRLDRPAVAAASSTTTPSLTRSARPSASATVGATGSEAAPAQLARRSLATAAAAGGQASIAMPTVEAEAAEPGGGRGQLAPATAASVASGGGLRSGGGSALSGDARRRGDGGSSTGEASAAAIASRASGTAAGIGSGLGGRGATSDSKADAAAAGSGAARSPGRDSGGLAAAGGTGTAVDALPDTAGLAATGGRGGQGSTGTNPSPSGRGERLGPTPVDRGRRGTTGRSALASARGLAGAALGSGAAAGDEEGLSISPADLASLDVTSGRRRAGLPEPTAGPRSPERIAAAALPADGRVRDVAEAFAGRRPAVGQPAGGIDDAEDLDRARAMVERGLEFLARSQLPDGRWRLSEFAGVTPADVPKLDSDTAATGLALLCFFGAGHDHFDGRHRDTVRRGLEFLISVQKPDGDLFLPADDLSNSCGWLYSHGIAAIAVCEAVGMTGDPLVKPAAEKACRFIADTRHPTLGGWRYIPRTDADLSVSGWMLVALRAGDLAGVPTDPAALDGVRTLLAASSTAGDPTRFAYNARKADQRRTDLSVACMTAVGTLMRLHTGASPDDPGVAAAAEALAAFTPSYGTATRKVRDAYLWYYASQVLVHTGGEPWEAWYGNLVDTLEPEQRRAGDLAGSWDATGAIPDRWGLYGGRLYVTALHLLALEVPWRHLPTYATAPAR